MALFVEIKRVLPGFSLNAKLECGAGITGVLGASGAGKSMLLNCIAGLIMPTEGRIVLNDKVLYDSGKKISLPPRERKVGFLFQNYALFPHLTIADNISFGLGDLSKAEQEQKVKELLERFHLGGMEKRYPSQISGGQQQRVALARALAVEPEILLLDEPFSALDEYLRVHMMKEMLDLLKDFQGITLCVTHNRDEVYRLCDEIVILKNGDVETHGKKRELFANPTTLETAIVTGCKNYAVAHARTHDTVTVPEWGVDLKLAAKPESDTGFVGIRANHIRLSDGIQNENCFKVWIADESEGPFRTNLYLKLGSAPKEKDDFHVQWEISKEQRETLRGMPQPLMVCLDPSYLFYMAK